MICDVSLLQFCIAADFTYPHLELEHLALLVAKLLERTAKLALVLAGLGARDSLVLTGRTTDERLDVVTLGAREVLLDLLSRHVALLAAPASRGVVEEEDDLETVGVFGSEALPLLLENCC